MAFEAPKGSEGLSSGDDVVALRFYFKACNSKNGAYYTFLEELKCTWNELFVAVAPYLINEGLEREMIIAVNGVIKDNAGEIIEELKKKGYRGFGNFEIDPNDFNVIKVQFRALGLICLSEKKRQVSDKGTYWKLTPYGDNIMTQLLAIRK